MEITGLEQGPFIGKILQKIKTDFRNRKISDKDEAIAFLKKISKNGGINFE